MSEPFADLKRGHYGAILADPPWHFQAWASPPYGKGRAAESHYNTMKEAEIAALPVADLAAEDCVLFMWACWPMIEQAFHMIDAWGFKFKTCGFCWVKADATQIQMFDEEVTADMLLGYWTRSNSEVCLLATRGKPKRTAADVRQAIIAPRREHSRKPDGIHERIERLVSGPYLELFARQRRPAWVANGFQPKLIDYALRLRKNDEASEIEHRRAEAEIARFLNHPIGTQPEFSFTVVDRTPGVDRAFADGEQAGSEGKSCECPHVDGPNQQAWIKGWHEGQATLMSAFKKLEAKPEAEAADEEEGEDD